MKVRVKYVIEHEKDFYVPSIEFITSILCENNNCKILNIEVLEDPDGKKS